MGWVRGGCTGSSETLEGFFEVLEFQFGDIFFLGVMAGDDSVV